MSVHLHVRSAYTLLKSTLTIPKIIDCATNYGFNSVALTDKNVMYGAMQFFHACKKAKIKPIIGMEVEVVEKIGSFGFVLLAKNDQGYLDLLKLSTLINTNGHEPFLLFEELLPYTQNVIAITNGGQDTFETYIIREEQLQIMHFLQMCKQYFKDFYVGIARNDSGLLKSKNPFLKHICKEMGILTVALSRIYYANPQEEESYKTLCAISQQVSIQDKSLNISLKRYFRCKEEMLQLYDEDDLLMSDVIASKCNVEMNFARATLPVYQNKYNVSSAKFLSSLCYKGLQKRLNNQNVSVVYEQRLKYELDIIIKMHFEDYFLIVWDFIKFSRKQGIYVGPGRGSAAGSLVSYCLGITHIDPIKYDLLFERFLNPERISMPDIDTDFPDDRRDEVLEYVQNKYGRDRAVHIITFNTLGAKQALRDVGKTMNIPVRELDLICKLIPNIVKVTLQYAYDNEPRFKAKINSSKIYQRLFYIACSLEGLPRHTSLHAAGLVISENSISEVCPLIDADDGILSTQFTAEYLEELGLIKIDFLGIRNLTIINEVVSNINKDYPNAIDIMNIPLNDMKTYRLIQKGDTSGIFQLESEGIKNLLRKMKPTCFEDIVATIALYRPGPMENIPTYLHLRQHPDQVQYIHPVLQPILHKTYGIMIYQEQIMKITQVMASFSLAKADVLRKAISKKNADELSGLKKDFIEGSMHNGYSEQIANDVYNLIMKFANYGFNRSHSVAYGIVAYQMAYLKANAPLYFYTSLLNSMIGSETKTSEYIFEAKQNGIKLLPPCVNNSMNYYVIENKALRYPLNGIKGIGNSICLNLLKERMSNGVYKDYFDFVARVNAIKIGKKTIETLIYAGALDGFHINRASLIASLDEAFRYGELVRIEDEQQVFFNFDLVSKPALKSVKDNLQMKSMREKEALGFYISEHPIENIRKNVDTSLYSLAHIHNQRGYVKFVCMIEYVKQHRTKKGDLMAFLQISDETYKMDLVCMPNLYEVYGQRLMKGIYLYVEGVIDRDDSCLAKKIRFIDISVVE